MLSPAHLLFVIDYVIIINHNVGIVNSFYHFFIDYVGF